MLQTRRVVGGLIEDAGKVVIKRDKAVEMLVEGLVAKEGGGRFGCRR